MNDPATNEALSRLAREAQVRLRELDPTEPLITHAGGADVFVHFARDRGSCFLCRVPS